MTSGSDLRQCWINLIPDHYRIQLTAVPAGHFVPIPHQIHNFMMTFL